MNKPILFSTEMVKAILEGNKTQTRRIIKPQPLNDNAHLDWLTKCQYSKGDILWVRETWTTDLCPSTGQFWYKADATNDELCQMKKDGLHWYPSIHMPYKAARLFLKITNIRIEMLNEISEKDSIAEGIKAYTKDGQLYKYYITDDLWIDYHNKNKKSLDMEGTFWQDMPRTAKEAFLIYWDEMVYKNNKTRFKTSKNYNKYNPWVWVIEFERINMMEVKNGV